MKKLVWLAVLIVYLAIGSRYLFAYDVETHGAIAQQAVAVSSLDRILKDDFGLGDGIGSMFGGKSVQRWITDGAASEDVPVWRALNHFHNPLYQANATGQGPWSQAGLSDYQSSVRWAQNPNQNSGGGIWSWVTARQRLLAAQTAATKQRRDQALADTFRAIGQLAHLVQDMSVPAHVRNDPHPISDGYEDWVPRNRNLINSIIAGAPIYPTQSIFSLGIPIPDPIAREPVARLWDTDQYTGANPAMTLSPSIGLAEYTNANFFTDDTLLRDFPFPARSSLALRPVPEPEPKKQELRRYFRKDRDGDTIEHIAVPSALYKFLPDALKDKKIGLDSRVYEDYARKLIPRAVGYSAALIDHFFRGQLDVDLFNDPENPGQVRVEGTNGSAEKLDGGTLTIYADNPDGVRSAAEALEPNLTVVADAGQPVLSAFFVAPEDAERFVAVYQGKLGEEKPEGGSPGGVIEKVLGGVRVEQLVKGFTKWSLRTPKGIFTLPISTQDVSELRWGDNDNTMIGRSSMTSSSPQFYAYKINRPLGSLDVPLINQPDGTPVVDVSLLKQVGFPIGMYLGTVIDFSHTIHYQQYILSYVHTESWTWNETFRSYNSGPFQFSDGRVQLMVDETASLNRSYPVVLDSRSYGTGSPSPYFWGLVPGFSSKTGEMALTKDGRILVLVFVSPSPVSEKATFKAMTLALPASLDGNDALLVKEATPVDVPFSVPDMGPVLWALVDVESAQVIASTAPSTLSIHHQTASTNFRPYAPIQFATLGIKKDKFIGGPLDGLRYREIGFHEPDVCTPEQMAEMVEFGEVSIQEGNVSTALNRFHPEIGALEFASPGASQTVTRHPFYCGYSPYGVPASGFKVTSSTNVSIPTRVDEAFRITPLAGPEQFLLMMSQQQDKMDPFSNFGRLVKWVPQENAAGVQHEFSSRAFHTIKSVSRGSALVQSRGLNPATSLIPLQDNNSVNVFPGTMLFSYIVFEPQFLYNVFDLKFYTKDASLRRTALPAALAPAASASSQDYRYHVIPVK
ncbi:MAG: hypothetical protein HY695_01795 [Deltaproteobacteria bacterium]|nr:hypothetical protein [Deltaproteobacteria bacterium]